MSTLAAAAKALSEHRVSGGFMPLGTSPRDAAILLTTQIVALSSMLQAAFEDSGQLCSKGAESGLDTLNKGILSDALGAIGSLAAVTNFMLGEA